MFQIAKRRAGATVVDDWYVYWALAKRLDLPLSFAGTPLDLSGEPSTTVQLLDILFRDARVPLDSLRDHPLGKGLSPKPLGR